MTAKQFGIEDLKRILREGAGEGADLDGDILDVPFEDLGYESLALLETGSRISREFGVELEETEMTDVDTPRALIDVVNAQLLAARA
ncbi:acyl carrier protein [Saccharopolyspora taberi]|uniref:Acyl carrier protein n=1 Tax=Saccharopolyspora taberi TaxID=60895 RepID=A0ABN3VBM8_9PSEU